MQSRFRVKQLAIVAISALLVWFARRLVWQAAVQLFCGLLVALTALPMMKLYERKLSPGLAASLAVTTLSALGILLLLVFVPALMKQGRQLIALLPQMYEQAGTYMRRGEEWLLSNGITIHEEMRESLLGRGKQLLSNAAPAMLAWAQGVAGGLSKWLLAPVFAYYFLRDRKRIGEWLLLLLPVEKRSVTIRLLREIRREISGYLRGQLLISLAVGLLTAAGLLICGVPAWLLLGFLMGIFELIPYIGPFVGGVIVLLFSLQAGLNRLLWAPGVVILVQQAEGSMLSPQMMSDATRLHPVTVLLCLMLGGAAGGVAGILLAVPLVLCIRAGLRVFSLSRTEHMHAFLSKERER